MRKNELDKILEEHQRKIDDLTKRVEGLSWLVKNPEGIKLETKIASSNILAAISACSLSNCISAYFVNAEHHLEYRILVSCGNSKLEILTYNFDIKSGNLTFVFKINNYWMYSLQWNAYTPHSVPIVSDRTDYLDEFTPLSIQYINNNETIKLVVPYSTKLNI